MRPLHRERPKGSEPRHLLREQNGLYGVGSDFRYHSEYNGRRERRPILRRTCARSVVALRLPRCRRSTDNAVARPSIGARRRFVEEFTSDTLLTLLAYVSHGFSPNSQ